MAIRPTPVDTVHVVVIDTRTPIGVAQLVDSAWTSRGKAIAREREINHDEKRHPNKVAWIESYRIHDGRLVETKRYAHGDSNGAARLTEQTVRDARERHRLGESTAALADEYGISRQAMSNALYGKTWRHVA